MIDEYSGECLAIEVAHSIPTTSVIGVLEALRTERGLPEVIIMHNGSEFTSRAFDAWAYSGDVKLDFIEPGNPYQNAYIESFNGTFRDDCLNLHWFTSIERARATIGAWRRDDDEVRPHGSLGELTPREFIESQEREKVHS